MALSGPDLRYGAAALALVGIAAGIIKWAGRALKKTINDDQPYEAPPLVAQLAGAAPASAVATLDERGIISPAQLAAMSPRERQFFLDAAAARLATEPAATTTPTVVRTPRNTPRSVSLGAVYCPACAALLSRESIMSRGGAPCPKCRRRISAQESYGRTVVTVAAG